MEQFNSFVIMPMSSFEQNIVEAIFEERPSNVPMPLEHKPSTIDFIVQYVHASFRGVYLTKGKEYKKQAFISCLLIVSNIAAIRSIIDFTATLYTYATRPTPIEIGPDPDMTRHNQK